jgi:CheY-like chemotaxis protein
MAGILFIDAEQPFADQTSNALRARGFSVTLMDDGKEGLDIAAKDRPDLIVLCVELPKMSGYSICNKLKKDNDLKGIPLIITSKEATPETFAQHKKLKTRAEDYLIKPFSDDDLFEKIGALISLPSGDGGGASGLEDLGGDLNADLGGGIGDAELNLDDALDASFGLDEPATAAPAPSLDEDSLSGLGSLDDELGAGFDGLAGVGDDLEMPGSVKDDAAAGLDAALDAMVPEPAPPPAPVPAPRPAVIPRTGTPMPVRATPTTPPTASSSAADLQALQAARRETSDLKAKVAELEARLRQAEDAAKSAASVTTPPTSASSAREVLTLKQQLRAKDDEILQKEGAIVEVQEQLELLQQETAAKLAEASHKDIEISTLSARVSALTDERDQLEAQVQGRLGEVEAERDQVRAEASALRQETDSLRHAVQDAGARADELATSLDESKKATDKAQGRIRSLEVDLKEKEQDAMKAYQLLKAEEQLREKARQAAELAVKLLRGDVDLGGGAGLEA